MRKLLLFWIGILAIVGANAQVGFPCGTDTISVSGSPGFGIDTAIVGDAEPTCYPDTCGTMDDCHYWQLPPNYSGSVFVYTEDSGYVSVFVIQDCRYIVWDTCAYAPPFSNPGAPKVKITGAFPPNCQLLVCDGPTVDTVIIFLKPHMSHDSLQPYFDIDTCFPLASVHDPVPRGDTPPLYTHYFTRASTRDYPTEPGVYIISWPESPYRPREKIVILH